MPTRVRWALYLAFSLVASLWLNGCAVLLAISGSGGGELAGPLDAIVEVAYLPTRLFGVPQTRWFYPDLMTPILLNVCSWSAVGVLIAGAHHVIAARNPAGRRTRG
jgi:hypothetical protein